MATYIILSRISPDALNDPKDLLEIAATVAKELRAECPEVKWKQSYALMGRYDVLDIIEAESPSDVEKAVMIIRAYGHSETETLPATPWTEFLRAL